MSRPKVNYLSNKEILKEIHKSKNSFSSFTVPSYCDYDIILSGLDKITAKKIEEAKQCRADRLAKIAHEAAMIQQNKKLPAKDFEIDPQSIKKEEIIFRIMTFAHIPLAPGRKKTVKKSADRHVKLNFPPFQHWKFDEQGHLICVGKSHWKGDLDNGNFSINHGKMTERLGGMFLKLCERYGTRGNVRGYTYNDEMQGQAILQLAQVGLQFDESKSQNPFAYYTAAVTHSFIRIINLEKRNQTIRDDILEINGLNPSWTRQSDNEFGATGSGGASVGYNSDDH